MKKIASLTLRGCFCFLLFSILSCEKNSNLTTPPSQASFLQVTSGSYIIDTPGIVYKIPIGLSTPSTSETSITLSITSPTGATLGNQFTLNKPLSFTIPAGQVLDTLVVTGDYSKYSSGRKDTVIFTMSSPSSEYYSNSVTLKIQGPCFEGAVSLPDLLGNYAHTIEYDSTGAYSYGGPGGITTGYLTAVSNLTSTGATSATGMISNLYDDGWPLVPINLDWSDPANLKVYIPMTNTTKSYGTSGLPTFVTSSGTGVNTFSYCRQTFNIAIDLVNSNGIILSAYQFKIKR